jgi:glyoxylate/hydroxypyruvate reductase
MWGVTSGRFEGVDMYQMVLWPEDRSCERAWLLENIKGAAGVLVLLGDRVCRDLE